VLKGKVNARASLAAVGIGFWLTMAGGVSAGPNSGERIIGGSEADPADWPFIAAITTRNGSQFCGGSVIAKDAVVTAAHCMFDYFGRPLKRREVRVVTGRPDLRDESEGKSIRVGRITVHQEYKRNGHRDVAVLNLARNTPAPAVDLPTPEEADAETTPGSELWVAGWGGTKPNGAKPSDVLLDVAVYAISDEECEPHFSYFRASEEVCAYGAPQGGNRYNDSCYGDSGGPLVADTPGGRLLVGLVSYGGRECGVREPGVYAEVARNLNFIERRGRLP